MTDLRHRISRLFASALNIDVPSVDIDLFETGVLDSLAFVELLLQLEREFGVVTSVVDLEIENFRSIARIAEFVAARTGAVMSGRPSKVVGIS
jgi:D-alanine--poly(phosphoribitol) ligase subunit 2